MVCKKSIIFLLLVSTIGVAQNFQPLKVPINSPMGEECNPSLSGNGRTLVYEAPIGDYDRKLIAVSYQRGGVWSKPEAVPGVTQKAEKVFTGGHSLSFDGNYLFFASSRYGGIGSNDLYYVEKTGSSWSSPKNIGKPINSTLSENDPALSPDGRYFYFVRYNEKKTTTGKPCGKVYIAERKGRDAYGEPRELPPPVNLGCECNPRPLADNSLTFASERKGGKGGYDQYKIQQQEDGSWSPPVPLSFINSKEDDLYISIPAGGDFLYMTGKSKVATDIVRTLIPENLQARNVLSLTGTTTDVFTNKPVAGKILVRKLHEGSQKYAGTIEGYFSLFFPEKEIYHTTTSAKGYFFQTAVYNLDTLHSFREIRKEVKLVPLQLNQRYVISDIQFTDDGRIAPESGLVMEALKKLLSENPTLKIQIERHHDLQQNVTDSSFSTTADSASTSATLPRDATLTEAEAIKKYLVENGIMAERMTCQGYAATRPCNLAPALSVKCTNARVEILVTKE